MSAQEMDKNDQLMLAVQIELDRVVTKEVCDAVYESARISRQPPQEINEQKLAAECTTRKGVIMGVIANSVGLERLYFIVRSSIMGGITGLLTFAIISLFKITGFLELVLLGMFIFIVSLLASRVFDRAVVGFSSRIIVYLKKHRRIQDFILKRL